MNSANTAWRDRLASVIAGGEAVRPRGQPCVEQLHQATVVDLERSLITLAARKLNHRFAAAEALWILNGSDRLSDLLPFNSRMAEFSDDGVTLAGAYGPRIVPQLPWVVSRLLADPGTRQAVASIWTPTPRESKDIPCTIALTFMIRGGLLHCHAFMRSSDVWLGLPYDLFSFSQVALHVLARVNSHRRNTRRALTEDELERDGPYAAVRPGQLYLTAASSHLYDVNREAAEAALKQAPLDPAAQLTPLMPDFTEHDLLARLYGLLQHGSSALERT